MQERYTTFPQQHESEDNFYCDVKKHHFYCDVKKRIWLDESTSGVLKEKGEVG